MITGHEILGVVNSYSNMMWPGMGTWVWPMMWLFSVFFVLLFLAFWIYTSIAYMEIATKLKYKYPWLAWIPFARGAMILQLGEFGWGLIFLDLVPVFGWIAVYILLIISTWRVFEKRRYSGWLALVPLVGVLIPYLCIIASIAFLVILGFVAWEDKKGRR